LRKKKADLWLSFGDNYLFQLNLHMKIISGIKKNWPGKKDDC